MRRPKRRVVGRGYDVTESKLLPHGGFDADSNHVHSLLYSLR